MSGYIGKVKVDNQGPVLIGSTLYGICESGVSATAKVVTLSDFNDTLPGVTVHVKFVNGNSATSGLTLKVGGTLAYNISGNCVCAAGEIIAFTLEDNSGTKTWIANHSIVVEEGSTNGTIKIAGQSVSVHGLGAAAYKDVDTAITTNNLNSTNVPTTAAMASYVQEQTGGLSGLSGAMHFRGEVSNEPTNDATSFANYISGDVVLYGDKEYVYVKGASAAESEWIELGDETSWALRSETVLIPGSSTTGDILYHNGTAYTRLGIGTNGQILKVSSGIPSWATGAPGDVALGDVSNNATLNGVTGQKGQILYWSDTNTPARLAAGTNGHVLTLANGVPTWSANTATDENVAQTGISTNAEYAILLKKTTGTTNETDGVNFVNTTSALVTVNPSTGTITAIKFKGDGSELTNVVASSVAWANITGVPTAANGTSGVVTTTSTVSSADGYTAAPIIGGVVYYQNTHNTAYLYATTSSGTANAITATSNPYLTLMDGGAASNRLQLVGAGGTTISAANGTITITSKKYKSVGTANALTSLYLSYIDSASATQSASVSNSSSTPTAIGLVDAGVLYIKSIYYGTTSVSTGVDEDNT